jgi:hypothetical protein
MKQVIIATLLSGLIGPGVGQLYNKDYKKGWFMIGISLFIVIAFISQVTKAAMMLLPPDATQISVEMVQQIQQNIFKEHPRPFQLFRIVMLGIWSVSIIDAFFGAEKKQARGI